MTAPWRIEGSRAHGQHDRRLWTAIVIDRPTMAATPGAVEPGSSKWMRPALCWSRRDRARSSALARTSVARRFRSLIGPNRQWGCADPGGQVGPSRCHRHFMLASSSAATSSSWTACPWAVMTEARSGSQATTGSGPEIGGRSRSTSTARR